MTHTKYFYGILTLSLFLSLQVCSQITQPAGQVTDIVKAEGITDPSQLSSLSSSNRLTVHKYVDGFGRPLQKILVAASPDNGKDIIQFYKYDDFGHQTQQYLSFAYTASSSPYEGLSSAITNQASFYSTTGAKVATDSKPWVKMEIEQSPMQRLLKRGNVGDGFQTDQHYKTVTYRTNASATDGAIRKWASDGTSGGTYSDNDLSVTEGADENGNKGMTFTDKIGRVILKRQQADETINGTTYPYFDTYYVYDLLGNISYIVPPKAIARLNSLGTWNVTSVPNLTYHYTYDAKNRVIIKKIPNATNQYIVYDLLDRVVLIQDGNMRANNKWYYTKYDNENRTIIEGLYTDATHTSFNDGTSTDIQVYINGLSCYGSSSTTYYELRTTGTSSGYTNNCFPTSGTEERMYFYYDDYDFDNNGSADYSYTAQGMTGEQSSGATNRTLGLPTGVKKKILSSSNWLISYTFYDKWYHPIQTISNNELKLTAVTDMKTQVVDIAGRITSIRTFKSHTQGSGFSITVNNTYSYDKMDHLLEVRQTNNSQPEVIVGHYEYNAIGQLVDKKLHSTNSGSSYLQSIDFRYNIRGQVTSMNNGGLVNDGGATNDDNNDVFGMDILYEATDGGIGNTANYTGLVSAVKWMASPPHGGNRDMRSYVFTYDKLNRLKGAAYKAATSTLFTTWTKDVDGFNENVTYDWNGNITTLQRKAIVSGYTGAQLIDDLTYDYGTNNDNNQLLSVAEHSTNANASMGFNWSGSSTSFTYDDNGNLLTDPNKGTSLSYNELNKITGVSNFIGSSIGYEYDASGARISKTTAAGRIVKKLYYIDGFVFDETYALSYFQMPEGRVRPATGGTFVFEYFITDQQGNVRVSFEDDGGGVTVHQENSYYPFGMVMPGAYTSSSPNKNLYNAGSEWQDEYGVANYYSTFFREYDPMIGRFNSVDPEAEASTEFSIYHYAADNPVNFNDPMGNKDNAITQDDIDALWNSPFGGTWNAATGLETFTSEDQAFYFGANLMEQNHWWGGGSGWATSFSDALNKYNGGNITPAMAAEYYQITWGSMVTNVSGQEAPNGFTISFTATSTGQYYSNTYFVSLEEIKSSFTFLADLFGDGNGNKEGLSGWEKAEKTMDVFDKSMTLTGDVMATSLIVSNSLTKETFKAIANVPVLKQLGVVTNAVGMVEHGIKFFQDPNWKDGLEFVGNAAVLAVDIFVPEGKLLVDGAEFLYNNITALFDLF